MTQKTFDGQTATFLSKLIASFPGNLTGDEMQKCIDDPKGLRDAILAYLRPISSPIIGRITFTVTNIGLTGALHSRRGDDESHVFASRLA